MRFTASSKFNSIARGAAKYIQWKVYAKKTSSLSEALTYGTWIDCTGRVNDLPPIRSGVEYQLGQFKADNLQLSCSDIDWWEANVLNTSAGQSIEMKLEARIGLSETDLATDIVYAFSGLVDPMTVNPVELDDTLTLTIYTADELANRMTAETIVTRYVNSDVDGSDTPGLLLKAILGVWVTDANISTYVLKAGLHTIAYNYSGGDHKLKLDQGAEVIITGNGFWTLGDSPGATPPDEQRVVVYVDVTRLQGVGAATFSASEKIIVKQAGDTLPYCWHQFTNARRFLNLCFNEFGITTQVIDAPQIASYDGNRYLSYLDLAPNDPTITATLTSMVAKNDNTLYLSIGTEVYQRTYNDYAYTLLGTMASAVDRLFYDSGNNWLWIVYGGGTKVKVYKFATAALSAEHSLTAAANINGIDKFEPNSALIYTTTGHAIRQLKYDGTTFTDTELFNAGTLTPGYTTLGTWGRIGNDINFYFNGITGGTKTVHYITWNGSVWIEGLDFRAYSDEFTFAAFNSYEDELYYWDSPNTRLRWLTPAGEGTVVTMPGDTVEDIYYDPYAPAVYLTSVYGLRLLKVVSGVAAEQPSSGVDGQVSLLTSNANLVFGSFLGRRIWQYGITLDMFLAQTNCEGITIKAALNKVCQAFNLMTQISSIKAAYVYRRGSDDGTPQTSGNNLTVNTDLAENLSKENLYGKAFDLISIDNGIEKHTYDGTTGPVVFDKGVFGDKRILEITNDWIPTELIKHLLYRMWQFFKTDRSLYRIPLGIVPLFQYEILDKVTASFTTSKIAVSGWGPIMNQTLYKEGSMDLEVLI